MIPSIILVYFLNSSATEFRNWLFYYSLPCMKDILDDEFFQHYSLFDGGIYLLSSRSVSPEQLELAGNLLMHFVEMFDAYYGMQNLWVKTKLPYVHTFYFLHKFSTHCGYAFVADFYKCLNHVFVVAVVGPLKNETTFKS